MGSMTEPLNVQALCSAVAFETVSEVLTLTLILLILYLVTVLLVFYPLRLRASFMGFIGWK